MTINTGEQYEDAIEHVKVDGPSAEIKRAIVRCSDDYERAVERVTKLGMPPEGTEDEAELNSLIDAIENWDARHEDDGADWA